MLPIHDIRKEIEDGFSSNAVLILSAPTGSGKSTQVPQMLLPLLPDGQRLLILQPRRLAARMLAERVAEELKTTLGDIVGFQTRYERVFSRSTRILFITEGILTHMLMTDASLAGVSGVIFDEFHERSLAVDLGLAMAAQTRRTSRSDLRIVVMSATLDTASLRAFLPESRVLTAQGRLFPVEMRYIKPPIRVDLLPNLRDALGDILFSNLPGDILVFMPGVYEIRKTEEFLAKTSFGEPLDVLPLYGDLPPERQRAVMRKAPHRKVIIATNIAETSLTIPGVRFVIDSGLVRLNRYDAARGFDLLETRPISRDSADQRAGRAGREAPGRCYRLWPEQEQSMKPARSIPEIERVDLAEAVLAVKAYGYADAMQFPWFERPPEKSLVESEALLTALGVVAQSNGALTSLGRNLLACPAHPRLALLMYTGILWGIFDDCAKAAAILSGRALFSSKNDAPRVSSKKHHDAATEQMPQSDVRFAMNALDAVHAANFSLDICNRLGVNPQSARDAWRTYEYFSRIATHWKRDIDVLPATEIPHGGFLRAILRAFPDRLAAWKSATLLPATAGSKGAPRELVIYEMAHGKRVELARESAVRSERLVIACDLRETAAGGLQSTKRVMSMASGILEEWLWEDFPNSLRETCELFWDDDAQRVMQRTALLALDVTLEETTRPAPPSAEATEILVRQLATGKLPLDSWDDDVEKWLNRVRWLRKAMPEHPLPAYDDADIQRTRQILCDGETSYKAVRAKSCLDAVKRLLNPDDIQFVEKNAPAFLILPKGRRMKIDYIPGQTPRGRARIQDIFDMTRTMRIAGGRVALLMDILAPNNRTVQITDDMESFWAVQYPKIKPQLSRRYPRHEWR